jgi:hypothetical protein
LSHGKLLRVMALSAVAPLLLFSHITHGADPGKTPPPLPKAEPRGQVAIPAKIEPIDPAKVESPPLFHHVTLRLDQGFGTKKSKNPDTPEHTDIEDTTLTLGLRIGAKWTAALSGAVSSAKMRSRTSPAFGAIPVDGDIDGKNYRVTAGYDVLPLLSVGASYGYYDNSGFYQYNIPVPQTGTDGRSKTLSLFANGVTPIHGWLVTTGVGYHSTKSDYTYRNNVPPSQDSSSEIVTASLGLLYPVNNVLRMNGGVTFNHTLHQSSMGGVTSLDDNWLAATLGLTYKVNKSFDLNASWFRWLNNDKDQFQRATVGVGYHF